MFSEFLEELKNMDDEEINVQDIKEEVVEESIEGDAMAQASFDSKNANYEKDKETTREVRKELAAQGIATKEDGTPIYENAECEENKLEENNKLTLDESINDNILAHQQKLREPEEKAVEAQDPAFAQAAEDIEKANEKKAEFVKIEKAPEHEEKGKTPDMTDGAKKLYLDESLFTDFDEPELLRSLRVDIYADNIIEVSEDNASGSTYEGSTAADVASAVQSYLEDNELND